MQRRTEDFSREEGYNHHQMYFVKKFFQVEVKEKKVFPWNLSLISEFCQKYYVISEKKLIVSLSRKKRNSANDAKRLPIL